jgi:hypothetical protein
MALSSHIQDMSRKPLIYHTNIKFYTQYTHPTLICRGADARTDRWTENIYSIFRDKLLLLGEHVLALRDFRLALPSLSHTFCLLNVLLLLEILIWMPSLVMLGEISHLDEIFFSLELGLSGLITNLESTIWALVINDVSAWVNSLKALSLLKVTANSKITQE